MYCETERLRPSNAAPRVAHASRLTAWLCLAIALTPLVACGKKGDPLPPLRNIPAPTRDLQVSQQGRQILLDMAYPQTTVSGLSLGGIDQVELLQLVKPAPGVTMSASTAEDATEEEAKPVPLPSADAREFEAGAETLLTLRGAELNAAVVGDRLQFRIPLADDLPSEPAANIFAVRTLKGDETSQLSNRATLVPIEPPAAPSNLQAQATADGIELSWEAESDFEGFDIFRREAQIRGYDEALDRVEGDVRSYVDARARFDRRYIYTVRGIANVSPLIHTDEAGEREIEYEDRFPPPLPANIVALAERASVRLRWDPSEADDVAGYIIFRREPARDFHRINDQPVTGTEFLDRNLTSGLTYAYQLKVVDRSGNESPLSDPVVTTTR
ncbi:MAG: fibronectin type III domain-containing protein [Acidobacteriota bacterium]